MNFDVSPYKENIEPNNIRKIFAVFGNNQTIYNLGADL